MIPVLMLSALAGCAGAPGSGGFSASDPIGTRPQTRPDAAPPPPPGARTAEALDTTTPEQRAAATAAPAAPAGERELGTVAVSLGSPAEPGFWLRWAGVTTPGPGRVVTAGGQAVLVDLIPGEGAAQLSLPAFRALGLPLAGLATVTVHAR
ncbi:MAG TPA: D-galactarate dehydratase [Paracoccaceae bacterium]|nr:D-galactarate dehydratase [Paracoccaceae bacterium]